MVETVTFTHEWQLQQVQSNLSGIPVKEDHSRLLKLTYNRLTLSTEVVSLVRIKIQYWVLGVRGTFWYVI